ncbi:MAG: alpha/beta hydrolase [Mesorhizobium sp.]
MRLEPVREAPPSTIGDALPARPSPRLRRWGENLFRWLFRMALHLPEPWLERLSETGSGPPVSRPGADPRARFHAWLVTRFGAGSAGDPVSARQPRLLSLGLLEGPARPLHEICDLSLPGTAGILRARLYVPDDTPAPAPALIFLHFGGCVLGDLDTCHTACTILARHGHFKVLSVEYRLAPEHKFPAAVEDTISAFRWLRLNAPLLGVDPGRIGIGGDSAGGYLAAAASLFLMDQAEPLPKLQLLMYPVLEMERPSLPATEFDDCYPLTRRDMEWFADQYMRSPQDASDPLCSVARAPRLAGMPPTLLVQARHDLLFDEGQRFAARLRAEGVPLLHRVYPTLPHAFSAMSGGLPAAHAALVDIARAAGAALATDAPPFKETC